MTRVTRLPPKPTRNFEYHLSFARVIAEAIVPKRKRTPIKRRKPSAFPKETSFLLQYKRRNYARIT